MKIRRFFGFFLALLLLSCTARVPEDAYVIGFYNVENLFDTEHDRGKSDQPFLPDGENNWTGDKYGKKLANLASVIRAMSEKNGRWHAVLALAEVENDRVLEDLTAREEIAAAGYRFVHYESPDVRGIDCALLYRPADFELLESYTLPFDFDSDIVFEKTPQEQRSFKTRDVLFVRGRLGGEMFGFYVAHLPSRSGDKGEDLRCRGAEIVYNDAMRQESRHPGIKLVVMGDMNDNPEDRSMSVYLHGRERIEDVGGLLLPVPAHAQGRVRLAGIPRGVEHLRHHPREPRPGRPGSGRLRHLQERRLPLRLRLRPALPHAAGGTLRRHPAADPFRRPVPERLFRPLSYVYYYQSTINEKSTYPCSHHPCHDSLPKTNESVLRRVGYALRHPPV